MINFHKFGFLDINKMKRYTENNHYWHTFYCPNYVYIWCDLYKTEIAYDNDFCFMRFNMPGIGMCYYPPMKDPNSSKTLEEGLAIIKKDAYVHGFDFYIAPVDERFKDDYRLLEKPMELFESENYSNYIYHLDGFTFFKGKDYKAQKKLANKFEHDHKDAIYKIAKKEDFPAILEFIGKWKESEAHNVKDQFYYAQLNAIKRAIEAMYELNLLAVILSDGNGIVGVAIGTVENNIAYLHFEIALGEMKGSYEELLMCFALNAFMDARYLNREMDFGNDAVREKNLSYKPCKIETFNGNFSI